MSGHVERAAIERERRVARAGGAVVGDVAIYVRRAAVECERAPGGAAGRSSGLP